MQTGRIHSMPGTDCASRRRSRIHSSDAGLLAGFAKPDSSVWAVRGALGLGVSVTRSGSTWNRTRAWWPPMPSNVHGAIGMTMRPVSETVASSCYGSPLFLIAVHPLTCLMLCRACDERQE